MKVLVIEDSKLLADYLTGILKTEAYEVTTAITGREAMQYIHETEFNIILLDLILPDIDGIKILKQIRKNHNQSKLPVIAISGINDLEKIAEVIALGANDFVSKPYSEVILKLKIGNLLLLQKTYNELNDTNRLLKEAKDQYSAQVEELKQITEILSEKNKALHESEAKHKVLFDYSGDIIILYRNFKKYYVNPAVGKILGYSQDEFLKFDSLALLHPNDKETVKMQLEKDAYEKIEKNYNINFRQINKQGIYVWISAQIIIHEVDENDFFTIINARDVTQEEKAKNEIRKLSSAISQSHAAIVITDKFGNIEYVNPKFTELSGYSVEESIGKNPRFLKSEYHPREYYEALWKTISSGQIWKGEFCNKHKDGSYFWEDATISPIYSDNNEIVNFVNIKQAKGNKK